MDLVSFGLTYIAFGRIPMDKKMLRKVTVSLVWVTLLSLLGSLSTPPVTAQGHSISISPTDGFVGDTILVNGTIDTLGGSFTVRWNHAVNFTGVARGNQTSISFSIPPTVGASYPSGRNVTVELIDEALDSVVATANFKLFTKFDMRVETPRQPKQLQEGNTTSIRISVSGGLPNTAYPANITVKNPANHGNSVVVLLSNTTSKGSGNGTLIYPTSFGGAHANLTGTYFASSNVTAEAVGFFVGLTDKTEYRRKENVQVQAAGYKQSETVKVNIKFRESSVAGFPKNSTASSSGLVKLSWQIPVNATPGTYHIAFANTTQNGTVKTPSDSQEFKVLGVTCLVQAKNLADEAVESASVELYNASATIVALNGGNTNSTGWIRFNLDEGNYTLKAYFMNVQVGSLANKLITADTNLTMHLSLSNFLVSVKTEEDNGVPLVDVALKDNKTGAKTAAKQTNAAGMAAMRNIFANRTYRLEAKRYGLLFSNTTVVVEPSPALGWTSLNLTLPNHTLNVHATDSQDNVAFGVDIRAYEWSSGAAISVESDVTNSSGDASFSLPFGRYILRAFKGDDFLSETVVDLDESTTFSLELATLNVNVIISVLDYYGQPLANAEVRIERKVAQEFVLVSTPQFTGSAGSTKFSGIVGGDSRVSVYLGGKLIALKTQFLGTGSNEMAIGVTEYVAVAGYPLPAGTFVLIILIFVLIVVVLVAARRRITQVFRKTSKQ